LALSGRSPREAAEAKVAQAAVSCRLISEPEQLTPILKAAIEQADAHGLGAKLHALAVRQELALLLLRQGDANGAYTQLECLNALTNRNLDKQLMVAHAVAYELSHLSEPCPTVGASALMVLALLKEPQKSQDEGDPEFEVC